MLRTSRFAPLLVLSLLMMGMGQETIRAQQELRFRRIYVPADSPDSWPPGDWVPMSSERLGQLDAKNSLEDSSFWSKRAVYEATLKGETLRSGRLYNELERFRSSSRQFSNNRTTQSWGNTNLAFQSLRWKNGPVKIGNTPDGETIVLLPSEARELAGTWSAKGRVLEQGAFFDLTFPPSAVTELILRIPQKAQLHLFDQVLKSELESNDAKFRRFRLSLGSSVRVRFFVDDIPKDYVGVPQTAMFTRSETLILMSRDQSRLRQEVLVEALGGDVRTLRIPIPWGVEIRDVDWGGIPLESWSVSQDEPKLMTIELPESFSGLSRPIRLTGIVNQESRELWRVPRLLPVGAHPISELVTLNVNPPLELLSIQADGFRQTAASTSADGAGSFVFQRSSPRGEIDVRFGLPPTRLRSAVVTTLDSVADELFAEVEMSAYISSGRLFSFWFDLASGWDPLEVKFLDRNNMRVTPKIPWSIETRNRRRSLRIELPKAIDRDQPLHLSMKFRGQENASADKELPVVRMPGEIPSEQWLLTPRSQPIITSSDMRNRAWKELPIDETPEWEVDSIFPNLVTISRENWLLWKASKPPFQSFSKLGTNVPTMESTETRESITTHEPLAQDKEPQINDEPEAWNSNTTEQFKPFSAVLTSELISHESNRLSNRLRLELPTALTQIEMMIPNSITEFYATIDGAPLEGAKRDQGGMSYRWSERPGITKFEFYYQISLDWQRDSFSVDVPLPRVVGWDHDYQWELFLPTGSQISEYSDSLVLRSPRRTLHWSQRLFGPLGRRKAEQFFDPTHETQWVDLGGGESRSSDEGSTIDRFDMKPGSSVYQISVWSVARSQSLAWLCFVSSVLIGIGIRVGRFSGRAVLTAFALSVLTIASQVLADPWVYYSGSVMSGILVAILCPRFFLVGRRLLIESQAELETEVQQIQIKELTMALFLTGFLLAGWNWADAQTRLSNEMKTSFNPIDLLIPYVGEVSSESLPELIYVREQHLPLFPLRGATRSILITSAEYECHLFPETVTSLNARYQLDVPSTPVRDFFTLPIQGANLSRLDGCLLNGKPVVVSINQNGELEIPLSASLYERRTADASPLRAPRPGRTPEDNVPDSFSVELELILYPLVDVIATEQKLQLSLPPVSQSRFVCRHSDALKVREFQGHQGEISEFSSSGFVAQLGKSTVVTMSWASAMSVEDKPFEIDQSPVQMDSQIAVEAFTTHLNYRFRVRYQLATGQLTTLRWLLPKSFQFRKILSDGILQTRQRLLGDNRLILIDLQEPLQSEREPFVVEAEFVVPILADEEDEISVPIPELWHHAKPTEAFAEIKETRNLIGIWSPPELPLAILELPSTSVQRVAPETFMSAWPEDASLKVPQFVYEVSGGSQIGLLKSDPRPQKQVWVEERGTVGEEFLEWTWQGEIQTSLLPAFEHEFLVDPRLEILSVSVKEDQAERVNRWSRDGNRLIVRLTRKTEESSQDVEIRARLPLIENRGGSEPQELELPEIRLLGADRMESVVEVFHVPTRELLWKSMTSPPGVSVNGNLPQTNDLALFDVFSRREAEETRSTLLVGFREPRPYLLRQLTFSSRADGDFDVELQIRETQVPNLPGAVEYEIPEVWVGRLKVTDGENRPLELSNKKMEDGTLRVVIPPDMREQELLFRSTLHASEGDSWKVPVPEIIGEFDHQTQVSLSLSEGWGPRVECRVRATEMLLKEQFPKDRETWDYLCDEIELQRTELSDPEAVPLIPLLISQFRIQPDAVLGGSWWLHYRGRGADQLEFRLHPGLNVTSVSQDGAAVSWSFPEKTQTLQVAVDPNLSSQTLRIDWTTTRLFESRVAEELELWIPSSPQIPIESHQAVLVSDPSWNLLMHHGIMPETADDAELKIVELYLRLFNSQELIADELPEAVLNLLNLIRQNAQDPHANSEKMRLKSEARLKRWNQVLEELDQLLPSKAISEDSSERLSWGEILPDILPRRVSRTDKSSMQE